MGNYKNEDNIEDYKREIEIMRKEMEIMRKEIELVRKELSEVIRNISQPYIAPMPETPYTPYVFKD